MEDGHSGACVLVAMIGGEQPGLLPPRAPFLPQQLGSQGHMGKLAPFFCIKETHTGLYFCKFSGIEPSDSSGSLSFLN